MRTKSLSHLAAAAVLGILCLTGCSLGRTIVDVGLKPHGAGKNYAKQTARWEKRVPGITAWRKDLLARGIMRDTFMVYNGARLHAYYIPAPKYSKDAAFTAIVVHGYNVNPINIMMLGRMYHDEFGFNVLMPSLRDHGKSEGECVQMGWLDRLDLIEWSKFAHGMFDDYCQVYHGMSMGAATVMMASGENLPYYVRGIIEDCGYTSVGNELVYALKHYLSIKKPNKVLEDARQRCLKRFGWDMNDASSQAQLTKCTVPMLFIHGDSDKLVPSTMLKENYDAKMRGYREMWLAPGSKHSMSYPDHPEEYTEKVRTFFENHVRYFDGDIDFYRYDPPRPSIKD